MANSKEQAEKFKNLGNKAMLQDEYNKAIELYNKAIEINPTAAIYYNNRCLAFFRKGHYEQALVDAENSLRLDPQLVKAHVKKAETLIQLGLLEEAHLAIEQGMEIEKCEELAGLKTRLEKEQKEVREQITVDGQANLIKWLRQSKARFSQLDIAELGSEYRGVVAKKKIQKKDQVLYIPKSHMITLELAKKNCPTCVKLIETTSQPLSPKHTYLSLYLLQERAKPESFWKPYIAVLPTSYGSFPIFFEKHELEELEGSSFLNMIRQRVEDLKKDFELTCRVDKDFKETFMDFCWARTTVCSRIFGLVIDGIKTDAMVPFADMLNHRVPKHTSWNYSQQEQGFVIESIEDIEKGQEVFDSYGKKCNTRFLLNYGFVMPNNDANEVSFRASYLENDPLMEQKMQFCGDFSEFRYFKANKYWWESGFPQLLGYLRFVYSKDLQILRSLKEKNNIVSTYFKATMTPPLNLDLELLVWLHVQQLCQISLSQYPTTLEQDQEKLKLPDLPFNVKNCIVLRLGEKQIFHQYLNMAKELGNWLKLPKVDLRRTYQALRKESIKYVEEHLLRMILRQ